MHKPLPSSSFEEAAIPMLPCFDFSGKAHDIDNISYLTGTYVKQFH